MNWKEVNLIEICDVIAGQSPPSSSYNKSGNGIPFFQGKADFGLLTPTIRYWCDNPKKISLPDDILISVRAPVGPTNLNNVKACIGRGLSAIRCKERINNEYLLYFLRCNEKEIADKGTGSTFKAITQKHLKELKIPLPSLGVQRRIAGILDAADLLRQKDKALISKYNELTQSLFLEMFGDPAKNLKKFKVLKLIDVIDLITYGLTVRPKYYKTGIPLISAREIKTGIMEIRNSPKICKTDFENLSPKGKPKNGDILFSKTGSIGNCAEVKTDIDFAITQNVARISFKKIINIKFSYYYLQSSYIQTLCKVRAKGNAVKDLQLGELKKFAFLVPPIQLQNQFAERVEAIEKQKAQAEAGLLLSEDLFNSLLQRAFKGELVL
jgi:type I restriction enzyme, S subunit